MRVSTNGSYAAVLANLMAAQQRQIEAGERSSSMKNGSDLKDFARNAEMLTAMRSVATRISGYQDQNLLVADRLNNQDTALNQIANSASTTRQAIADALASGRADSLMDDMQANMRDAVSGLNTRYGGKYLFAGGQIDTPPFEVTTLAQLTAAPTIAGLFKNDQFKAVSKVDDSTTVTTGMLASDVGTEMMNAFKAIQAFNEGPDGPITGELTEAQRTFLEGQLSTWDTAARNLTDKVGANGLNQSRVDAVKADLVSRANNLGGMMGEIIDADMGKAVTDMQTAQLSVQAAAQVFNILQSSSLLNFLSSR